MANLNRIILVGEIATAPESRVTVGGLPVAKFKLNVERPFGSGGADVIDIVAWRKLAEDSASLLKKGGVVLVEGRIQNRSFDDQSGQRRWVTEVVAKDIRLMEKRSAMAGKAESKAPEAEEVIEDNDLASELPF